MRKEEPFYSSAASDVYKGQGYAKHKTGMDGDESLVEDITSTFGIDIAEKECGDALKDILKDILEQRQKMDGIEEFKIALTKLASAYIEVSEHSESPVQYPIYVLIDDLDRCRPNSVSYPLLTLPTNREGDISVADL